MTNDELPFGHPAQDPTPASVDRARARVHHTVNSRRRRRRVLGTVPVLVIVVGLAVAAVGNSTGRGGDHQTVYAGSTSTTTDQKLDVDANTPWFEADLSEDGLTLTLSVGSSPRGDGPCEQTFTHDVVETSDSVTIAVEEQPSSATSTGSAVCEAMAWPQVFTIELAEPLGGRAVYDGVQPEPRTIHRASELVSATWLPGGWVLQSASPETLEDGGHFWQQYFGTEGGDWHAYIIQAPAGWFKAPPEGGEGVDVTVNGIAAKRYDWFNGTAQTIHWVQDGLDISVTGEMQGPPTFTHDDDLLRIAQGVRMPDPVLGGGTGTSGIAPGTECLDGFEPVEADTESALLGKTVEQAETVADDRDLDFRVVAVDGECQARTDDIRQRINAVVLGDRVVAVALG